MLYPLSYEGGETPCTLAGDGVNRQPIHEVDQAQWKSHG